MIRPGICSVTFRQLDRRQVVELVRHAGLEAIEWGGDVHVPPENLSAAQEARRLTQENGLTVSSYGSYYKVLNPDGTAQPFEPILETALALGTDTIRIWSGERPSATADKEYREKFAALLRPSLDLAAGQGVRLALEFHSNSLTDDNATAQQLLDEVNHPGLYLYWQPMYWVNDPVYCLKGLEALRERILNLHVFNWRLPSPGARAERLPLKDGADDWLSWFSVKMNPDLPHFALLEFVRADSPEQFLEDAAVLKQMIKQI